jgi:hypothetical protein
MSAPSDWPNAQRECPHCKSLVEVPSAELAVLDRLQDRLQSREEALRKIAHREVPGTSVLEGDPVAEFAGAELESEGRDS